jgi:superoxide dismutase, Cu-Zn family
MGKKMRIMCATNPFLPRSPAMFFSGVRLTMKNALTIWSLPLAFSLSACAADEGVSSGSSASANVTPATATLNAADGSSRGEAKVTEAADGLHVVVQAVGLTPGLHAVHVHTTGTCTPPDFVSAGGHWNPTGRQHGKDNPAGKHMGDMPNMIAGSDGAGQMEYAIAGGSLRSGATPLLDGDGAAIVIHAEADDNKTDPAGNAGGRVACGVLSGG